MRLSPAFAAPAAPTSRTPTSATVSARPSLRRSLLARPRALLASRLTGPSRMPMSGALLALSSSPPLGGGGGAGHAFRDGRRGDGPDDDGLGAAAALHTLSALCADLAARYSRLLATAPVRTKAVTTGLLMLLSDYIAQTLTEPMLELARLARYLAYGALVAGPVTHAWYAALDHVVRGVGVRAAVAKTALDQMFMSPLFLAVFFAFMHVAEGRRPEDVPAMLAREHVPAFLASLRVWPLVNVVNFSLVPPAYRVVFGSAVSVGWITFLSVAAAAAPKSGVVGEVVLAGA